MFKIDKCCPQSRARAGRILTPHGEVLTPIFLPVGSKGPIKTLTPEEVKGVGLNMVLVNAYHLYLQPGMEVIQNMGGIHQFTSWEGPILTDSGGYQIFSLSHLSRVDDEGVAFRSPLDGSEHLFTPEFSVEFQEELGADIILALDECPASFASDEVRRAVERTSQWAKKCCEAHKRGEIYGIIQGGLSPELRETSALKLREFPFDGYAIGGLCLGETKEEMLSVVEKAVDFLPPEKPRHLMGVGSPEDIMRGVSLGVDIFDSALPTRVGRNGSLFTIKGRKNIKNSGFKFCDQPIDPECDCYTCRSFSAAFLHHLFKCQETLGLRLATIHNLRFIAHLTEKIRSSILDGRFLSFKEEFLSSYHPTDEAIRLSQKRRWLSQARAKRDGG
jgi:queuine tRNA-ribosyltransferase